MALQMSVKAANGRTDIVDPYTRKTIPCDRFVSVKMGSETLKLVNKGILLREVSGKAAGQTKLPPAHQTKNESAPSKTQAESK